MLAMAYGAMLHVGGASALTLTEAMAVAYETNAALLAARAGQRATDELLPQAKALYWRPQVTIFGNAGQTLIDQDISKTDTAQASESELTTDQQVGLSLELFLYRGGRTVAGIRNAEAQIDAGKFDLATTELDLLLSVVEAYAGVLLFGGEVDTYEQEVKDLEALLRELEDMFRTRLVTIANVSLVKTYVSQAQVDVATAKASLGVSTAEFVAAVGMRPRDLESWPDLPLAVPDSYDDALIAAVESNPSIKAALATVRADEAAVDELEGVLLPTISLYGNVSREWDKSRYSGDGTFLYDEFDTEDTFSGGVQLTMPIYEGGANYSFIREAKQTLSQSLLNLASQRTNVESGVLEYWSALEAARQGLADAKGGLTAANVAVDGALRQYREGTGTIQDLLTARDQRIDARIDYVTEEYSKLVAMANLFAVMGVLNARQLDLPVTYYDPDVHKREVEDKLIGFGD